LFRLPGRHTLTGLADEIAPGKERSVELFDHVATLSAGQTLLLLVAVAVAFGFECINGFHDTANAVATVIYTRAMKPTNAVIWSGIWNFIGVHAGGIGVAYSIVHLLPVDLLVDIKTGRGLAMVLSLLGAAILWNFATWYHGLPASSSHALIGSIMGVGMMNAWLEHGSAFRGINWHKATEVGLALLISPAIGFGLAAVLLMLARRLLPAPALHEPPQGDQPPPWWIRTLLVGTCTGVSFAHGSNDGQKGMGLIMLVLIGIVPAAYALDMRASPREITAAAEAVDTLRAELSEPGLVAMMEALRDRHVAEKRVERLARSQGVAAAAVLEADLVDVAIDPYPRSDIVLATLDPLPLAEAVSGRLAGREGFADMTADDRWQLRTELVELGAAVRTLLHEFGDRLTEDRRTLLKGLAGTIAKPVEYVPEWVVMGVALCLGIGTMFGWKRIVVTVGEKIGKTHLTYAQGATAELVAASTIAMADSLGMPVSTTHVLSSGVAGTMWANRSGLQSDTVKKIAAAWILTLPVVMALASGFYLLSTLVTG
jgi:low-affinity inorganic phosphate transporter